MQKRYPKTLSAGEHLRHVVVLPLRHKKLGVLFSLALSFCLYVPLSSKAQPVTNTENCQQIDGRPLAEVAKHFDLPLLSLEALQNVHKRIADSTEMRPILVLCQSSDFNASAEQLGSRGRVEVTTELVKQVGPDKDVLARIIGHEFAHISMRHGEKHDEKNLAEEELFPYIVSMLVERGNDTNAAREIAQRGSKYVLLEFDRQSEFEADEKGFVFSKNAGFSLDASVRIADLLKRNGARAIHRYFEDNHPGYLERREFAAFLEESEIFRRKARSYVMDNNVATLGSIVNTWTKKYSDSGAAFLYKGIWLRVTGHTIQLVNAALEDSVENFAFAKRGKIVNYYQSEKLIASSLLCRSLIYEEKTTEALNCLRRLPVEEIARVVKQAKWKTNLIVGPASPDVTPTLWSAQGADEIVYITNDDSHKDPNYMRPVQPWRAPRQPRAWENKTSHQSLPRIMNVSKRQFADLFEAARFGTDSDVYEKLISGADINEKQLGLSALSLAVFSGNRETVDYLLKAGADKNMRDGFNRIPLEYATRIGRADLVEALNHVDIQK